MLVGNLVFALKMKMAEKVSTLLLVAHILLLLNGWQYEIEKVGKV